MAIAHDRIQRVVLVLELTDEVVESLASSVVQLKRLIRICVRIWSILTGRQPAFVGNGHQENIPQYSVNIPSMAMADRIQQVVSDQELIGELVRSFASFVDQLIRFIRVCRGIWSIWTARQPAFVGIQQVVSDQELIAEDDIPLADANDEAEADADADVEAETEVDATSRQ